MLDLDQVVKERHSTRMFLPKPVPRELLDEAVALAQLAPSNSNIQPWHVVFVSGPPRERLVAAMLEEAKRRPPNIPPLPESFQHYRSELGAQVYGAMGIPIDDKAGHFGRSHAQLGVLPRTAGRYCLHASGPWSCGRTQRGNVSANVAVGFDRTRGDLLRFQDHPL